MISGLVVSLSPNAELAQEAIRSISQQPAIELGPREKQRQPIVMDTKTAGDTQSLTDWIFDLPGVDYVDVAFVHLEADDEFTPSANTHSISN